MSFEKVGRMVPMSSEMVADSKGLWDAILDEQRMAREDPEAYRQLVERRREEQAAEVRQRLASGWKMDPEREAEIRERVEYGLFDEDDDVIEELLATLYTERQQRKGAA